MASKLAQLKGKAAEASKFVAKHGSAYYKQLLEHNKQYIVDPPTVETCHELSKKHFYTHLASEIPIFYFGALSIAQHSSSARDICKELDGLKQVWKNRHELKVEDAGIAALFGLELYCWFCVGEIVGRGFTFTGYYV